MAFSVLCYPCFPLRCRTYPAHALELSQGLRHFLKGRRQILELVVRVDVEVHVPLALPDLLHRRPQQLK